MTVVEVVRSPPALSARALAAIAASIGQAPPVHLLEARPDGRRWVLASECATYQAWVIAWPPGTGLDLHDHDGSTAGVHIVEGRLRERYLGADGDLHVRSWASGESHELAPDHVHEVHNLGDNEAITIHVYSPRLRDVRFRTERAWVRGAATTGPG